MTYPRFHLAFPVANLAEARAFYADLLGCSIGRTSDRWIDFNFYGHQITAHLKPEECGRATTNPVDKEQVPVRHFGLILEWQQWHELAEQLKSRQVEFLIEPQIRFAGEVGEQATLFIQDPSGNALEFKAFQDQAQIFAS
ncbi:MAG: VOC family protein [Leptolyngbya sp. IPPAS B-1204]|uniref:VOC family protein n=1 Tax=Leptolyngbya sp. NK1-12 TaxID=2547451 RepID=A0AA96WTT8_9CYAN|nr:VOC family protein [Leptolyngbya sp. NK1-12]MBF2051128.1 VOC family protein [Elainella sp. C42_A2020_010]RNJ65199.1 MAG: glyoxalase [Leptolyngbya sp. IPPAS B-1204]WNZ22917.1 VOC family protein [Leptolyngbya sp. NK1-12]